MSSGAPASGARQRTALTAAALGLLATLVLALALGAMPIAPGAVVGALLDAIGIDGVWSASPSEASIVLELRLPRVLLGALVGGGLALCGAATQTLLRNPLADPTLLGVSSGAALCAGLVLVVGPRLGVGASTSGLGVSLAAFVGALLATAFVYALGRREGRSRVATMLLAGVGVNALAGAATAALTYVARDSELRSLWFWALGSLSGASFEQVGWVALLVGAAAAGLALLCAPLDALLLGEAEAYHLGHRVAAVQGGVVTLSALATAACVASVGIVGFVGLVVPHLARMLTGARHRALLPMSALVGGALLVIADLVARTAVAPAELPLGVVTAALGAPFFLALLLTRGAEGR